MVREQAGLTYRMGHLIPFNPAIALAKIHPMPYQWSQNAGSESLSLWPHRSLSKNGFVAIYGGMALLGSLPLFMVIGSNVLWGLLPFVLLAFIGLWWAIMRSYRDGQVLEVLTLKEEDLHLVRRNAAGQDQEWRANPHWVRVTMHAKGGPLENYVTLRGAGREVEIGAFLSSDERQTLYTDLRSRLGG